MIAGAAALAIAAAATAAAAGGPSDRHEITIRLPGGGIERIEYTGKAPQVVVDPAPFAWPWAVSEDFRASPAFAALDRMSADMDRQMAALFEQERDVFSAAFPGAPMTDEARLTHLPPGTISTSWFSASSGHGVCTRVTQISTPAFGSKPHIVSRETGDCGSKSGETPGIDSPDSGIIQAGSAFCTDWLRRNTPRAALLCPLAGIALAFL